MKVVKLFAQQESPIIEKLRAMDRKRASKALKKWEEKVSKKVKQKIS